MLLVMYCHARGEADVTFFVYAFHIPLFFFLNGMTLNIHPDDTFGSFLERKIKSYLVPLICLGFMILSVICCIKVGEGQLVDWRFFFNGLGDLYEQKRTFAIWFVAALFISDILFYLIYACGRGKIWAISLLEAALLAFSIVSNKYFPRMLAWNMDAALFGTFFVFLGFIFNNPKLKKVQDFMMMNRLVSLGFGLAIFAGAMGLAYLEFKTKNLHLEMFQGQYKDYWLTLPAAFLGSLGVVLISKAIDNKVFSELGKTTLVLLAFHQIMVNYIFDVYVVKSWFMTIPQMAPNSLQRASYAFAETGFDLLILVPLYYVFIYTPLAFTLNKPMPGYWLKFVSWIKQKLFSGKHGAKEEKQA